MKTITAEQLSQMWNDVYGCHPYVSSVDGKEHLYASFPFDEGNPGRLAEALNKFFGGDWRSRNPQICPECKTCLSYVMDLSEEKHG